MAKGIMDTGIKFKKVKQLRMASGKDSRMVASKWQSASAMDMILILMVS